MIANATNLDTAEEDTEAILRRADEALKSLRGSFSEEAKRQIGKIEAALDSLSANARSLDEEEAGRLFEVIFEASHELKGQAGSFGYDLLTHVCDSLCHVIDRRGALPGDPLDAIRHHLDAARLIFDQNLTGNGGAAGAALLGELGRIKAFLAAAGN